MLGHGVGALWSETRRRVWLEENENNKIKTAQKHRQEHARTWQGKQTSDPGPGNTGAGQRADTGRQDQAGRFTFQRSGSWFGAHSLIARFWCRRSLRVNPDTAVRLARGEHKHKHCGSLWRGALREVTPTSSPQTWFAVMSTTWRDNFSCSLPWMLSLPCSLPRGPNTTKHKTGPKQKAHQRQAPGEPDRRGQKGQGGSRTQVSPFTFLGVSGSWVGALSLCRRPVNPFFLSASLATRPAWSKGVPYECQLGDSTKLGRRRSCRERQLGGSTKLGLPKGLAEKRRPSAPAHSCA